ncbi:MAG: hypothetical protein ABSF37_01540 [Sedimentisphaerales bacterium]|jgi:spore germination protein GerM
MIDKINTNQISDHFDGSSAGKSNHSKAVTSNQADDTLQIDNARLIEQAVNSQPTDTDAVQKARELIQSGQLDTPANIKEAAANIAKFGV